MRTILFSAAVLFTAAPALADGVPEVKASCDQRKTAYFPDTCIGFTDKLMKKGDAFLKANCSDKGSVLLKNVCPKEQAVGQCIRDGGSSVWTYYAGKKYSASTAKTTCQEDGTWVPAK
jgi:hypothetical protein